MDWKDEFAALEAKIFLGTSTNADEARLRQLEQEHAEELGPSPEMKVLIERLKNSKTKEDVAAAIDALEEVLRARVRFVEHDRNACPNRGWTLD